MPALVRQVGVALPHAPRAFVKAAARRMSIQELRAGVSEIVRDTVLGAKPES